MAELLKIVAIGLITIISNMLVKQTKPEIALIISIAGSILIISLTVTTISSVVRSFYSIFASTGIDSALIVPLLKIVAIGYIAEFGANLCVDAGVSSIADKILFSAKLIILLVSLPIITNTVNLIMELL